MLLAKADLHSSPMSSTSSSSSIGMHFTKIVNNQREYFESGLTTSLDVRKVHLMTLKQLIKENGDELAAAVQKDLHKLPGYTQMEIAYAVQEIDYILSQLDTWAAAEYVNKTVLNCLDQPMIVKQPLGVVLLIAPWNYPLDMVLRPLIPILAAGNTVVVKPSEVSDHTTAAITKIFPQYFPPELVSIVNGDVAQTTELLKERFDHIFYTGSTAVGKIVMAAAAQHLTPVTLELGGKSPCVVMNDAQMDVAGARIAWGKWMNCGQTCVAPDYILVTEESKAKLVDELERNLEKFYGKDIQASKDYGRIINQRHFDRLSTLLTETRGKALFEGGTKDYEGLFFPPVIVDVARDDPLMKNEIFGPILPIVTMKDLSEAIQLINSKERPLAAYIFTSSEENSEQLIQETYSGGVCVNDVVVHILVDTLPFGGVGHSGMGRYHGKFGFDTFTHEKAVLHRGYFGESLMSIRYPPLTDEKLKTFKLLATRRSIPRFLNWIGRIPYWFCD